MLDQDAPPVEEGETGGGVDAVRAAQTHAADLAAISSRAAFIPRPWTTAIALPWAAATAPVQDGSDRALAPPIRSPSLTHCRSARTPTPESSASWTTYSSRPNFRKPLA